MMVAMPEIRGDSNTLLSAVRSVRTGVKSAAVLTMGSSVVLE
jgi:hypothetical protein